MQNTGENFGDLLGVLTEDELNQYGRVALDQVELANRWFNVQVPLVVFGAALGLWGLWLGLVDGFSFRTLYWIAPGLIAIYWLSRSVKSGRLWRGHYSVVHDELERRGDAMMDTGSKSK